MREIKFRAWDIDLKKYNREAHIGCYGDIVQFKFNGASYHEVINEEESKDRFILEQYTGVKDRDGKEIYEGDVLENVDFGILYEQFVGKGKVIFHCGSWSIQSFAKVVKSNMIVDLYGQEYATKVIGNIHENKEYGKAHV